MLKFVVIAVVVVLAALLIFAATRPDTFQVARSTSVKAPPEKIFAHINDLPSFNTWNPYERKDPAIKGTYRGAKSGTGAAYAWESDKVGVGSMEITESSPASRVAMKLDFVKPFEAHNIVEFTMQPQGESTQVTWAMRGPSPYISKLMGIFINMDRMIGTDFEAGLANLKAIAEK
jgi:hypothetical protein